MTGVPSAYDEMLGHAAEGQLVIVRPTEAGVTLSYSGKLTDEQLRWYWGTTFRLRMIGTIAWALSRPIQGQSG